MYSSNATLTGSGSSSWSAYRMIAALIANVELRSVDRTLRNSL